METNENLRAELQKAFDEFEKKAIELIGKVVTIKGNIHSLPDDIFTEITDHIELVTHEGNRLYTYRTNECSSKLNLYSEHKYYKLSK